ncbi:MAG TPA: hypothetical protein VK049_05320 [Paenalcaligenes sp.]|nr:hypothetical protein [Paenalcaligenes sp.]
MNLAILIALLALTGIVYGLATGFKDAANPEGGTSQKKLDPQAARERKQRGRRTFWGSIIVFILVALWYGFMYESPADIEKRQAKERTETCEDILAAYNAAQNFVANFVPGAEFPIIPQKEKSQVIRPCEFEIHATVFERSADGETKQPFTAWLNYDGEGDRWDLEKLIIGDQEYSPNTLDTDPTQNPDARANGAESRGGQDSKQPEVRLPGLGR